MGEFIKIYSKITKIGEDQSIELLRLQDKQDTSYSRIKTCQELWDYLQEKITLLEQDNTKWKDEWDIRVSHIGKLSKKITNLETENKELKAWKKETLHYIPSVGKKKDSAANEIKELKKELKIKDDLIKEYKALIDPIK